MQPWEFKLEYLNWLEARHWYHVKPWYCFSKPTDAHSTQNSDLSNCPKTSVWYVSEWVNTFQADHFVGQLPKTAFGNSRCDGAANARTIPSPFSRQCPPTANNAASRRLNLDVKVSPTRVTKLLPLKRIDGWMDGPKWWRRVSELL